MVRVKIRRTRPAPTTTTAPTNKRRMTVDPGIDGSGIAVWAWETWGTPTVPPIHTDVYTFQKGTMEDRLQQYFVAFRDAIQHHGVEVVVVEWPEFFDSATGLAAANSGGLMKLCGCAMAAMAAAWSLDRHASAYAVRTWKGQLPKRVVQDVVERCIGRRYASHDGDAVGLGLWLQGAWSNK